MCNIIILNCFRTGDISMLQVDAVVNPTNETMDDKSPMCQRIFNRAGSALKIEIYNEIRGLRYIVTVTAMIRFIIISDFSSVFMFIAECKTGEVRVTQGHGLPARFVIHTVGPVYNIKYQTAAQNTLHYCYR